MREMSCSAYKRAGFDTRGHREIPKAGIARCSRFSTWRAWKTRSSNRTFRGRHRGELRNMSCAKPLPVMSCKCGRIAGNRGAGPRRSLASICWNAAATGKSRIHRMASASRARCTARHCIVCHLPRPRELHDVSRRCAAEGHCDSSEVRTWPGCRRAAGAYASFQSHIRVQGAARP